jgi:hypothetical protein
MTNVPLEMLRLPRMLKFPASVLVDEPLIVTLLRVWDPVMVSVAPNTTVPELALNVPPEMVQLALTFVLPDVVVKVPADKVYAPFKVMVEFPPENVPLDWL